jgi:hypothetical protein
MILVDVIAIGVSDHDGAQRRAIHTPVLLIVAGIAL